jgi:protein-tyrosine phosphatase
LIKVLVMCTANRCRSPIVEGLLRARIDPGCVAVSSAGFLESGRPAESGVLGVLDPMGIDMHDHRSRSVDRDLLDHSDLVITMEVAHLMSISELSMEAYRRSFTLLELDRAWQAFDSEPFDSLAASLHAIASTRKASALLAEQRLLDVPDPMGQRQSSFDRTAALVAEPVVRIARELNRLGAIQ